MSEPRVFAYGLGATCAAGEDLDLIWASWRNGKSRLAPIRSEALASPAWAGLARPRAVDPGVEPPGSTVLALARSALRRALAEAGLEGTSNESFDLLVGTTVGLGGTREDAVGRRFGDLAEALAREAVFRSATTVVSGCTASMEAIATGADRIRSGLATGVVAGGADALSELVLRGFEGLGMLARAEPRPFDRRRAGCALGDGAAFVVLLDEEEGRRRGMRPLAEVRSSAAAIADHAASLVEPEGTALAETIEAALEAGGARAGDLAFVQAFGIGTAAGDPAEANALRSALGRAADATPITAAKAIFGHTLGAAGALEAALVIRSLAEGVVPPIAGLEEPDPACALGGLLREEARPRGAFALQVGVGLCGQAAALLWRKVA